MGLILDKNGTDLLDAIKNKVDKQSTHISNHKLVEYLKYCAEEKAIPLPIMSNISNGILTLENHKLTDGISKALGKFLPVFLFVYS